MKRISKSRLATVAVHRPEGYLEAVVSAGKDVGDFIELSDESFAEIRRKFQPTPPLHEQIRRLGATLGEWGKLGFPVANQEEFSRRMAVCETCPEWTGTRCLSCGCIEVKQHLANAKCPLNLW